MIHEGSLELLWEILLQKSSLCVFEREMVLGFKKQVVGSNDKGKKMFNHEFQCFNLNPVFAYEYTNDLNPCTKSQVMWYTVR